MPRLEHWHKRLILFIAAADIGAIAAALAAHFGLISHWLGRTGLYLAGELPTSFEVWAVFAVFVLALFIGISGVVAPSFAPILSKFISTMKPGRHTPTHESFRALSAFTVGMIIESVVLGIFLSVVGRSLLFPLFFFTGSAGKTALVIFGLLGIIFLLQGLGEFGYTVRIGIATRLYRMAEKAAFRAPGAWGFFLLGLARGSVLGIGVPYPIYLSLSLLVVAMGNIVLGTITFLLFAVGRLIPLLYLLSLPARGKSTEPALRATARLAPRVRFANGVILVAGGSYLFIFWWIYASLAAFFFD